jgi:hypothetical protein
LLKPPVIALILIANLIPAICADGPLSRKVAIIGPSEGG